MPPARPEKDRWHQLADAVQDSNLPASDKSVFRYLLDRADYGTAVMRPMFTPTRQTIARKTSLSYSQVGYSTRHLQRHGWLTAGGRTGPGRTLDYSLTVGASCDCTGRVHEPKPEAPTQPTGESNAANHWHRTLPTNAANAAGQTTVRTGRHREGGGERQFELKPESQPGPKYGPQPVLVVGDGSGPDDRDSFDDWLGLISGRAEPSRGTPPGRQPRQRLGCAARCATP